MSAVNEWIVREYFELNGFLVSQPRKYAVPARQKKPDEELDLLVFNPHAKEHQVPANLVWTRDDLKNVQRAVVGVRGWHTERFYVSTFEQAPDICRFAEPEAVRHAGRMLGTAVMAKILCIPRLPASGELRDKSVQVLRDKGIDGLISFETMLAELIYRVETHKNYEKSDLLQIIRIMKNYNFIADRQMDFFARKRRPQKYTSEE